jgi:tripartite-type tricarboxylate transporter receptor subunit TctC
MIRRIIWWMGVLTGFFVSPALAADFPARAITLICPVAPGGILDIQLRAFAAVAEKQLGKPVVVLNKPGGSGALGTTALLEAKPDGYTIGLGWSSQTAMMIQDIVGGRKPPFTIDDFAILGQLTNSPPIFNVKYDSRWKTMKELIEDVKAHPNAYSYPGSGIYSMAHLPHLVMAKELGLKMHFVPTRGGGDAMNLILGGHVSFGVGYPGHVLPLIRAKQIRPLVQFGEKRVKNFEDVPTFGDLGFKNVTYYAWVGLVAPKNTPSPILERLQKLVKDVAYDPAFVSIIENAGDQVDYADAETLRRAWQKEYDQLYPLIEAVEKEKKEKK